MSLRPLTTSFWAPFQYLETNRARVRPLISRFCRIVVWSSTCRWISISRAFESAVTTHFTEDNAHRISSSERARGIRSDRDVGGTRTVVSCLRLLYVDVCFWFVVFRVVSVEPVECTAGKMQVRSESRRDK